MNVLIIDDNKRLAQLMSERLRKWYVVDVAHSGERALALLSECYFDMVVLDLGLPGMNGLEVCSHIKKFWPETAVLVVTGEDSTRRKIELLDAGADDYITKPFETQELHARIRAQFRRKQNAPYRSYINVGPLTVYPETRTITLDGEVVKLRRKEYNILEYLCLNQGRVLTREMIVNNAWPVSSVSWTGSVSVHIKQIRDKIDQPPLPSLIKTVYGLGYMIEASQEVNNGVN